jgi:hypothetical protein
LIQELMGGMIMLLRKKMYFKTNGSGSISSSKECVEHVSTSEHAGYIISGMILNLPTIITLHRPSRCPIGDHVINLRSDKDASKFSFQSLIWQSIPFDNGILEDRGDIGQWNVNATVAKNGEEESVTTHPIISENGEKQTSEKALPSSDAHVGTSFPKHERNGQCFQAQTHGISMQNKPVITERLCSSGHDDRYKSRSVGDGNWMGASIVSSFSDVVPCQGLYFAMYLALVIHPGLWTMEVGYTYLAFLPMHRPRTGIRGAYEPYPDHSNPVT